MTELQKALGRTELLSGKYSGTLSNLTRGMDKNSLSIKDAEKAMYDTDKVLRGLTRSFLPVNLSGGCRYPKIGRDHQPDSVWEFTKAARPWRYFPKSS
jgi:hypothetical protein